MALSGQRMIGSKAACTSHVKTVPGQQQRIDTCLPRILILILGLGVTLTVAWKKESFASGSVRVAASKKTEGMIRG